MMNFIKPKINGCINKSFKECIDNEEFINVIIKDNEIDTQEALAESIEISTDLLRNIENSRNIGSITTLLNLCNALEITPNFLFADLLPDSNDDYDNKLYSMFNKISRKDKELLKQIIIHIDKKY